MDASHPLRVATGMVCPHAKAVVEFLLDIGLSVVIRPGAGGFVSHISILEGALLVDPRASASNILHEAGHIAVCPSRFRAYLSGDLEKGFARAFDEIDDIDTAEELHRNLIQAGETEATAWAWAAGFALGIPEDEIVRDIDYGGAGKEIRLMLSMRCYLGINGLARAGFCKVRARACSGLTESVFPNLNFWLQD